MLAPASGPGPPLDAGVREAGRRPMGSYAKTITPRKRAVELDPAGEVGLRDARPRPAPVRRYLTRMRTTVSTKGQIVVPAEIRQQDGIEPGQVFEFERVERGEYRLVRRDPPPNDGVLAWLLACPEPDFYVALSSESTDTL